MMVSGIASEFIGTARLYRATSRGMLGYLLIYAFGEYLS